MSAKKIEKLALEIQSKLDGNPAILVGSGCSVPYGLPTMSEISDELTNQLGSKYATETSWIKFQTELSISKNLETALGKVELSEVVHRDVIKTVWDFISSKDKIAIEGFIKDGSHPSLALILSKFVLKAGATNIITTNYDRLIEYSIDVAEGDIEFGFSGNIVKKYNRFNSKIDKRGVNLYKVHGSLDWFKRKDSHSIFSSSDVSISHLSTDVIPMIVTPGIGKYRETHNEPFRTVLSEADKALRSSKSYLCIGYGFNDEHVQPILIDENKTNRKSIVIVTKHLTEKIKELFLNPKISNCLIITKNEVGGTRVYYSSTEIEDYSESYWELSKFYNLWF